MSDDQQPPEKPTVKFEPPPKWAEAMFARVHEGIAAVEAGINTRLDDQGTKLDHCINGLKTVNAELETVKADFNQFKGATNTRLDSNSMRAKQESIHDEEQDNRIAKLSESQMAALLKAAAKTPMGQKVANAAVLLVLAALSYGTWWLSTHGHHDQLQQQTIQVPK